MARACNAVLATKIGYAKIDDFTEISLAVSTNLDDCALINTRNYVAFDGAGTLAPVYNAFKVPDDLLQCLPRGSRNTGTLTVSGNVGATIGTTFRHRFDATDFVGGLVTAYFTFPVAGSYEVGVSVADITQDASLPLVNFDRYTKMITVDSAKTIPVVFMLDEFPDEVGGQGWAPSTTGALLRFEIKPKDTLAVAPLVISSISLFTSLEDFEINDTVKIGCVEDFTGDVTLDVTENNCFGATYNTTTISMERTFTGASVTPNYWKLNPLESRGDLETGWVTRTQKLTVQSETREEGVFGYIQLSDIDLNECAFVFVQHSNNCAVADSLLNRLNTPQAVSISEDQFILLNESINGIADSGKILFNEALVGETLIISYPQEVDAEHFVANTNVANERRVRLSFERKTTDGVRENIIFDNVLVTSFPSTITREEPTFAFTVSIQRDNDGNFYNRFRVN